jgi:hypothetical protein
MGYHPVHKHHYHHGPPPPQTRGGKIFTGIVWGFILALVVMIVIVQFDPPRALLIGVPPVVWMLGIVWGSISKLRR